MWETLRKEDVVQKLRTKQGVGLSQKEVILRKQKYICLLLSIVLSFSGFFLGINASKDVYGNQSDRMGRYPCRDSQPGADSQFSDQ